MAKNPTRLKPIHCAALLLGLALSCIGGTSYAQLPALWSVSDGQPTRLNGELLSGLSAGDRFEIVTEGSSSLALTVTKLETFPNGDRSLSAQQSAGDSSLVLTHSGDSLRATLFTPSGNIQIRGEGGILSLTQPGSQLEAAPADDGAALSRPNSGVLRTRPMTTLSAISTASGTPPGSSAALSGNDVSIEQLSSTEFVVIGDEVTFTINITNNLNIAINNQPVTIFFVLDEAEFVSSTDPSCTPSGAQTTGGIQTTLDCRLSTLAPGAIFQFEYTVRATASSYPFLASGVFVGEPFGESVRNDEFVFVVQDVLSDSDGDGASDFNEALVGTDPASAASRIPDSYRSTVDLMFLYTQQMLDDIGGAAPELEINQMVAITNEIYAGSGVPVTFRPVYYGFTDYVVNDDLGVAFDQLQQGTVPHFDQVADIKTRVGADIVVLLDGFLRNAQFCGLGSLGGPQTRGDILHPNLAGDELQVTLYLNGSAPSSSTLCSEDTLAHELGHNFGLIHSREFAGNDGTFSWSSGYGVAGSFTTVMAYSTNFAGATALMRFSDPQSNDCMGQSCGVDRSDLAAGADAVHSLNQTHFQLARVNNSSVLDTASLNGSSSSAIFYGGASRSDIPDLFLSTIRSSDSLDLSVTMQIPYDLQGMTGRGHLLVAVGGSSFFQLNSAGTFIPWDGVAASLVGATELSPLPESLTLTAFDDLVPASANVSSAELTAYFAFEVPEQGVFVYTAAGVTLQITP